MAKLFRNCHTSLADETGKVASMTWFPYSIGATICFGVMISLYRLPGAKGMSRAAVALWMLFVQLLLALLFFHGALPDSSALTVSYGFWWGTSFALLVLLQMYALTHVETGVLIPITSAGSLVLSVAGGLLVLHDAVSPLQWVGIGLAIVAVTEFLWRSAPLRITRSVVAVGAGIMVLGASGKLIQGVAASQVNVEALQIWSYMFGTLVAVAATAIIHRGQLLRQFTPQVFSVGTAIAGLSFVGGALLYQALIRGPFPVITTVHSTYIFVSAIVSWWFLGEQFTARKLILLGLAVASIVVIRLG